MGGPYRVYSATGDLIAGDPVLDDLMKKSADDAGGWIEDSTGSVVHGTKVEGS